MKKKLYFFKFDLLKKILSLSGDYAAKLKTSILLLFISSLLYGAALACLVPIFIYAFDPAERQTVFVWVLVFTCSFLLSSIAKWVANNFDYKGYMIQITQNLRTDLGRKLRVIPLEKIEKMHSGSVISTFIGSLDSTLMPLILVVNLIFMALVVPATVAIVLLFIEWRIAMMILLLFPVLLLFYFFLQPKFAKTSKEIDVAHTRVNSEIIEYLQGLSTLYSLNRIHNGPNFLGDSLKRLRTMQAESVNGATNASLMMATLVELLTLFILATGGVFVTVGDLDIAVLIAVFLIVIRLSSPLSTIVIYSAYFENIEVALTNIKEILKHPEITINQPIASPKSYDISFENVSYIYDGKETPALDGVTMELKNGSITALVGYSGSGKSTIIKMINRFADPQAGSIRIGGIDVSRIPTNSLSEMISVVFQDVYLFNDSVFNNIKMSRPNASMEEVRKAASMAYCDEFVQRLPDGYETVIGANGFGLSGGERQRISIARAILKNSPILILDEPTSALDVQSEFWVQKSINQLLTSSKTIVIVSHHLSFISGVDKIYVLSHGSVVEEGQHTSLVKEKGLYKKLYDYSTARN